jgi:hypothetical protein
MPCLGSTTGLRRHDRPIGAGTGTQSTRPNGAGGEAGGHERKGGPPGTPSVVRAGLRSLGLQSSSTLSPLCTLPDTPVQPARTAPGNVCTVPSMAKQRVDLRVDTDLLGWADDYAGRMRWTRTTVFEAALEALRADAQGGVPDVPKPRGVQQAVERQAQKPARRAPTLEEQTADPPPDFGRPDLGQLVKRGSDLLGSRPSRLSFVTDEEWKNAVRLWEAREGS